MLGSMEKPIHFCSRCGKRRPVKGRKRCSLCQAAAREYDRKKKASTPAGICRRCGQQPSTAGYLQCTDCRSAGARGMREWRQRTGDYRNSYQRKRNRKRRELVINHYGGQCACCGEKTFEFLAVDHVKGGGDAHRMKVGSGSNMIEWVIKNDFPPIFQILCHNCNQAIGYYGHCPHETREVTSERTSAVSRPASCCGR